MAIRRPFAPDFCIDSLFLVRVQDILDAQINARPSSPDTSPVIGATLLIYRFILDIINLYKTRKSQRFDDTLRLKAEMRQWEAKVLNEHAQGCSSLAEQSFYSNTLSLYILAASLLLD